MLRITNIMLTECKNMYLILTYKNNIGLKIDFINYFFEVIL